MHKENITLPIKYNKNDTLSSMLRVNHAGEYGAKRIYEGQLSIIKDPETRALIEDMYQQELKHLAYFENQIANNKARPTFLQPLWHIGGFTLGAFTALLGVKTAMLCTKAVEEVIASHYQEQIDTLEHPIFKEEQQLKENIINFRNEELEHHDIASKHNADQAPFNTILSSLIKGICTVAIHLSKRI